MKSFVYIALVVFLGIVAVQSYKKHGGPHQSSHWFHNRPSHGFHHGPPHHRPHYTNFRPPNQHGHWDNSYVWDDRSDSRDSSEDRGSSDSYGPDDSYGSHRSGPSHKDSGDRYDHHRLKYPGKPPHNKKPPNTTRKPIPPTPKPIPTTQRIPLTPILPPHATHTQFTPKPKGTTAAWRPNSTTPQIIPHPTITVGPIPRPPITSASRPTWHPTTPTEDITHWETTTNSVPETTSFIPVTTPSNPGVGTTTAKGVGFPTVSPEIEECIDLCISTPQYNPVCGSNGVTYDNEGKLFCAKSCGVIVEVLCEKPCAACGFNPVTAKTTTLRPSTTPQIGRTTQELDVQECINACPVTSEYNPVCGSNHVTYSNPSRLVCVQLCGVAVAAARLGPCGSTTTSSTTTVAPPPTLSPDLTSCIRRCPVTTEYDPVCGSDDLTYNNIGNLHCSKFCGVEVDFKHKKRCVDKFDLDPDGTDSTPSQPTQDINGTKDRVTTPSPSTATTT